MNNTVTHFAGQPIGNSTYEALDRLMLVEMRPFGMSQGILPHIYDILRISGSKPLSRQAAEQISQRRGSHVAIFTGMQIPGYMPRGETDGPVGSVVLGRTLSQIGYEVSIVVEPEIVPVVEKLIEVAALCSDDIRVISSLDKLAYDKVEEHCDIAIAIEKLGPNEKGIRHSVGGTPVHTGDERPSDLFQRIRTRGGLTIGIGDNGNEIGFGKVASQIRGLVPWGEVCRCDCSAGIVTATGADVVLPCAVSNYGGYVISCALSCLLERPDLLFDIRHIEAMVKECVDMGVVNGAIEEGEFIGDDGVPIEAVSAFGTLFRTIGSQYFVRVGDHR